MDFYKFETIKMRKSNFFLWLTDTLQKKGWVSVASNPNTEGWIYRSKGENGKDDIIVNFRDGYDGHNNAYAFSSTDYKYFDIRMLISYEPGANGVNGTHLPILSNGNFTRLHVGCGYGTLCPDAEITVRYNCNKDRMIFTITTFHSTTYCMFGRPSKRYSKEYSNTGNMIYTTHNNKLGNVISWGVADRPSTLMLVLTPLTTPLGRSLYNKKIWMSEIGFGSTLEGIKGKLEGIYYLTDDSSFSVQNVMDGDKIIDDLGNEFTIMYIQPTDSSNYPMPFPYKHIVVCTKLAGEE